MGEPRFCTGGDGPGIGWYRHDLADPAKHRGPIDRYGYCLTCHRPVVDHLIGRDGHCTVCGVQVVDVEKTLAHLRSQIGRIA